VKTIGANRIKAHEDSTGNAWFLGTALLGVMNMLCSLTFMRRRRLDVAVTGVEAVACVCVSINREVRVSFALPNLHQIHYALDPIEALNDCLRHLFEEEGRQEAVNDHHGICDLAPEPSQGCISARLKQLQCSDTKAILYRPKTVLLHAVGT